MTRFGLAAASILLASVTPVAAQQPSGAPRAVARPAAAAGSPAGAGVPVRASAPTVLAGTPENAFSIVQGNALDSTSSALPNSLVRLRDARFGRIVNTQLTDRSGLFAFRAVDPGTYIVELIGTDQTVLAASGLLSVNAGEAISAVVKLPFKLPPLGGLFGHTAAQAATVTSVAAATGVLNAATTSDVSPDGTN
jgi:hypothetical protein